MQNKKKLKVDLIIALAILLIAGAIAVLVSKNSGLKFEKYKKISHDKGAFGENITIHDAVDGEVVIFNKLETGEKKIALTEVKTTLNPDTIWKDTKNEATTSVQQTKMKNGSIGMLTVPKINLSVNVYESETTDTIDAMSKGAAHFPNTSAWDGTVGISAHNINFDGSAGYFLNLHTLKNGDEIKYTTALGERIYKVTSIKTIPDSDWSSLRYTDDNRITLITCISGQPQNRLCVEAIEVINK